MIWLLRLLSRLGLRWVVVGAVSRFIARRLGRSTVERAGRDLEERAHERLPAPVAKAVSSLPPEVLNAGGSAVVAGRAARGAVHTTRRAGRLASGGSRRAASSLGAARSVLDQVRTESDASGRRLRSRYLESTIGPGAATEALLDLRPGSGNRDDGAGGASGGAPMEHDPDSPHDVVPEPVGRGRLRRRHRPIPAVNRMRRGYRPEPKAWE